MQKKILAGVLFYIFALFNAEKYINIAWDIPFGIISLPAAFWLIFFLYSYIFIRANKLSWKNNPLHMTASGIALNLIYVFIRMEGYSKIAGYVFEAAIYKVYYYIVYYSAMTAICFAAAELVRRWLVKIKGKETSKPVYADYITVPFLAVFLASLIYLGKTNPNTAILFALITGLMSAGISLKGKTSAVPVRVRGWIYTHEKAVLVLFFVGALFIRVLYLMRTMTDPNYLATGADGPGFDLWAWKFANNEPCAMAYAAGYWIFVGFLYKIFGHNYFAVCFVQAILGSLTCLFIYYIIKEVSSKRATAYMGLFLACVNYGLIFSSISLGHQALDCFFLPFAALMLICFMKEKNSGLKNRFILIILALASGYAVSARESNIFLLAVIPFFMLIHNIYRKKIAKSISDIILFLIIFTVPLVPFAVRNIKNFGLPYPVTYKDIGSQAANRPLEEFFIGPDIGNEKLMALGIDPFKDPKGSLKNIVNQPKAVLAALFESVSGKFKVLFLDQEYGKFDILFLMRGSPFYNIAWFYAFIITIYGVFYMFILCRDAERCLAAYLILTLIFFKSLPHFLLNARFGLRPPIDVFLIVAFSIGAMKLFSLNEGSWSKDC